MSFKDYFSNLFKYQPDNKYDFLLLGNVNSSMSNNTTIKEDPNKNIYPSLDVNMETMKIKYNALINSDIIIRDFTLTARNKQYNAFIIYIDGMVDSELINNFVVYPLMLRNRSNIFDGK